jgi:acetoin utilization protein AcuB
MFVDKSMRKNVVTMGPDESIVKAKELMTTNKIRHIAIVEEDNTLIGIVSDRDIRSAMPSSCLPEVERKQEEERIGKTKVSEIMTRKPMTISPTNTLEDALLMMEKVRVGAFPVVDDKGKVIGMLSIRDLMRAFINVLGIHEPGRLLCILADDKLGTTKKIVDAISEEKIPFGSILVARHWEEGKRAVFPYLLTVNVANVKKKLEALGFKLLNPLEWNLDQLPAAEEKKEGN